jgi:hypothetical protein
LYDGPGLGRQQLGRGVFDRLLVELVRQQHVGVGRHQWVELV